MLIAHAREQFREWALELKRELDAACPDSWTDYIDPCSGLPVSIGALYTLRPSSHHARSWSQALSECGSAVYPEVDGFETLLKYKVSSAAGCRVIVHPRWGTQVYPATAFTTANPDVVAAILRARAEALRTDSS